MGTPSRKGWWEGSSLTYAIHLACDVTVGRPVSFRCVPEVFLEVDIYAFTTIHYSIHFRHGVQHKLGQETNPTLPAIRNLSISRFQHDSPATIEMKAREDSTGRNTVRDQRLDACPSRLGDARVTAIGSE